MRKPQHQTHAVALSSDGQLRVFSTTTTHVKLPNTTTESEMRTALLRLAGFRPADDFGHVIQQLKKGRTYLIRRGQNTQVEFTD